VSATAGWDVEGDAAGARLGWSAGTAGDVNGDGLADVVLAAPGAGTGALYLYAGAGAGLGASPAWTATHATGIADHAVAVGAAGDVNGDGYGDLVVGVGPLGDVFGYLGNGDAGRVLRPRQLQPDLDPLARWGMTDADEVQVHLAALSPLGQDQVRMQWQVAPLGVAFGAPGTREGTGALWRATGGTLTTTVTGLTPGTPYRWRVRLRYRAGTPLGVPASRWIHVPWDGALEKDFRTADGAIVGLEAVNDGPTTLGAATTLTATADSAYVDYAWAFGDGAVGGGPVVTHTYAAAGDYTAIVTASNSTDEAVATTDVSVRDVPIAGLTVVDDGPTPGGTATTFTATVSAGTGIVYAWAFGDGSPVATGPSAVVQHTYAADGEYTAVVTASNTANAQSASTVVSVTAVPIAGLVATNDSPTPLDDATTFTATVAAGSSVQYTWNFGDGAATQAGAVVQHVYPLSGTYTARVTATNRLNALSAATAVTITAREAIAGLDAHNDSPTPFGAPTTLWASISAGSGVTYTWAFGDGSPPTVPDAWPGSGRVITHVYPAVGIYTARVTATNRLGQLGAGTVVTVEEVPITGLAAHNDGPTALGRATTLSATVATGSHITYAWAFGDSATGSGARVLHTYPAERAYTATVTATNPLGSATAQTTVTIVAPRGIYLPLVLRDD
jgi:PKD repeat protein